MSLSDSAYTEIEKAWEMADHLIKSEETHINPWRFYGSDAKEYGASFESVLPDNVKDFGELAEKIKERDKKLHVLQVAGEGSFLRTLGGVDVGVAMSLTDQRHRYMNLSEDIANNIELVPGEVLTSSPWRKVDRIRHHRMNGGLFNLIVCRPLNGFTLDKEYKTFYGPELQGIVISRMWGLLSKGSSMFVEIPKAVVENVKRWRTQLKESGIGITTGKGAVFEGSKHEVFTIRIDKPNTVNELPLPKLI